MKRPAVNLFEGWPAEHLRKLKKEHARKLIRKRNANKFPSELWQKTHQFLPSYLAIADSALAHTRQHAKFNTKNFNRRKYRAFISSLTYLSKRMQERKEAIHKKGLPSLSKKDPLEKWLIITKNLLVDAFGNPDVEDYYWHWFNVENQKHFSYEGQRIFDIQEKRHKKEKDKELPF